MIPSFDHEFVPSGYPIRDKCKICGKYTITAEGLKSLGLDIIYSGSIGGRDYEMFLRDREEAIAHGVISHEQYSPTKLVNLASARKKRVAQESGSDIGIDQNRDGQNTAKSVRVQKSKQKKVKSATEVAIKDSVFYGETASTGIGKRKHGIVQDKNVTLGMVKVGKDWLPINRIWIAKEDGDDVSGDRQTSLFANNEEFSVFESLVSYVGMH